jgi:bifunctional DNA-binding transcriptional regulator/antitoxin component of YhaV-PrlF toxin-antitoxin module
VTPRGHLRLPAPVRHWCGLTPGSRVLLVAEPDESRLVIHPPTSLDEMIARHYADVLGGDAA